MIALIQHSLRALFVLTLLLGVVYPLAITGIAQLAFAKQANGSQILVNEKVVGSELIAQKFTDTKYFWPRPSAADFGTVASGASNQGFTSAKLVTAVNERRAALGGNPPSDLLYASASGLDPHISVEAAVFQLPRIAAARGLPLADVEKILQSRIETPQFGFLGQSVVNVLLLNLALDGAK